MQRLEVSGAVRPLYGPLGVKGLISDVSDECVAFIFKRQTSMKTVLSTETSGGQELFYSV